MLLKQVSRGIEGYSRERVTFLFINCTAIAYCFDITAYWTTVGLRMIAAEK